MRDEYYSDSAATFGDRVAAAREAVGLTQARLAGNMGVNLSTIESWEADRSEPRANKLQMLAGMLNVSMVWLMTGVGEGVAPPEDGDAKAQSMAGLLAELRQARTAYSRLTQQLVRIEKRLRTLTEVA